MNYSTLEELKIRLNEYDVVTPQGGEQTVVFHTGKIDFDLNVLIEKAKRDIIGYRHYPARYTEEMIDADLEKWHNILIDLVIYDYSVDGANFETNHTENGVNRSFVKRENILAKVIPFCNVLN